MHHYNRKQMADALEQVGLRRGDVVFSHSNVGYFGFPEEGRSAETIVDTILGAFQDVIGTEGTLVVPVFTYSFTKREPFDPDHTVSTCGMLTEMVRLHPQACRSHDPIFSVAALGHQARALTEHVSAECFGRDSFWDRFLQAGGMVCNLNFVAGSTFIHYVERCLDVPYRYDKLFPGVFIRQGVAEKGAAIFFCHDLSNPDTVSVSDPLDQRARARGIVQSVSVGRGSVVALRAADIYRLIEEELPDHPWFLTVAGKQGTTPLLIRRDTPATEVSLPAHASMQQMIDALWNMPRDIISDGYDDALMALATQVPMQIHEYPTGTHCWTWIVPEKWTCREAYLETLTGERLFSYVDNPLHVVSYSLPFQGEVSRQELDAHLHTHPKLPDAVPFKFHYYERDWGLCCTQRQKDALNDERYRVVIDTIYSYGTLKVGEVVVPGEHETCIVLCAHLCHPAQVNDDLAGVVVGIEVVRRLLQRQHRRYTYRLLIVPESIGSVAYLSHHEQHIPTMKGGIFLEMLGLEHPHALQSSFEGNTEMDICCTLALHEHGPQGWVGAYRTVIGNDERQFNAPGVRVPMVSLSRVLPRTAPDWPYPEHHSNHDSPSITSLAALEASCNLVLSMIDTLEQNRIPVNQFKGEVFLSRYGLLDYADTNRAARRTTLDVLPLIDGTRSLAEIARQCGASFSTVKLIVDKLYRHGLVRYQDESEHMRDGNTDGGDDRYDG